MDKMKEEKEEQLEESMTDDTIEENTEKSEEVDDVIDETEPAVLDSLEEIVTQKEKEAKENLDKWHRTMAEFDNFRKRTLKEKSTMYENGAKEVLEKLLPVIDNFERAIQNISPEEKKSGLGQGIDMIYKQFLSVLNEIGVEEIQAVGEAFDPNLHHAVSHEENDAYGENEVVEAMQKGYIYKDRVLRHTMVKVVN